MCSPSASATASRLFPSSVRLSVKDATSTASALALSVSRRSTLYQRLSRGIASRNAAVNSSFPRVHENQLAISQL